MATAERKEDVCNLVKDGTLELELKKGVDLYQEYRGIVVSGDKIIVVDRKACNVRLHRRQDGKLLATSDRMESRPRGICLINDMEICVIMWNSKIAIMSVQCTDNTGVIRWVKTLHVKKVFDVCHAAVKSMNTLIVCGEKEKTICWCIVSLDDGHFDKTHQICEGVLSYLTTKDNMIYISCYAGSSDTGVYGIDIQNPSKQKYIYKHNDLQYPTGITVDTKGFIFVCNFKYPSPFLDNKKKTEYHPCIHHLTDRCQLVTIYRETMPLDICDIFWDQHQGHLYVASLESNVITRYKPEYSDQQEDHKAPEVPVRDEGKQPVIEETSTQIRQEIVHKGQLSVETEMPPSVQVLNDSEDYKQDLQGGDEFLEAIINNDQKVEEMIRNKKIPKQSIIEVAMKRDRYSIGVQRVLMEMSKLLRMEIFEAVGVWCGYRPEDPHTPVFVVTLKNQKCIPKKEEIPKSFLEYEIIPRHKYVPNEEERSILEQYGSKSVRSEDVAHVNNCIAIHTESLMREHSNLSIIRPSPIKSCGYMKKEMRVKKDTCIVFYVPVKGIVPVGENEFPKVIDGIVTDVREGEFVLFGGHHAMDYHPKLRIGCCIGRCICGTNGCTGGNSCKTGSLGGFVDLPGGKVGCLTAAHVVLTDDQIKIYNQNQDEEKRNINNCLAEDKIQIEMHQPQSLQGYKPFGNVHTIALEMGNSDTPSVDAAIIQITDNDRIPETGSFPDGDFGYLGLTKEDPLLYTSGEILDVSEIDQSESMVIKFGCTTGLTDGLLNFSESSVRQVAVLGNYCFPVMYKQLEVSNQSPVFAAAGDSGALVFLCVGRNIRNLRAVGMVIGETSTKCSCIITPINAVFEKLGLTSNRFKVFPASQLSQLVEHINAQGQVQFQQNEVLNRLSEKIESIEQKIIDTIEQKINEHVHSGLSENVNSSVNTLEEKIKESSEKISSRVDTLEKNIKENSEKINSLEKNMKECFDNVLEKLNQMNSRS